MVKRFISANASDILAMSASELKQSIQASEGRIILAENVVSTPAWIPDITNSELARAFGADLILLNTFDVMHPKIYGLTAPETTLIHTLREWVGRPIGVNLEPVAKEQARLADAVAIASGRQATAANFKRAEALGCDFICLTGNPGVGVTNEALIHALATARKTFNGLIIAGKMHAAGVNEPVMTPDVAQALIAGGADILLVPAVGTVPGVGETEVKEWVQLAHEQDVLVMSAIGTSQESADAPLIQQIALANKRAGVDIQHIGDAGYSGLAPVENILALSTAIRGKRHTYSMMARSIAR